MLDVRITVVAPSASRRANIPATRFTSSRDVHPMTRPASRTPAAARSFRLVPSPSNTATSKRADSACSLDASVSRTVTSWSSWRASTMVDPTWPAPMTKTRTSGKRTSAHGALTPVGYRAPMRLAPLAAAGLSVVALATVSGSALGAEGAFRRAVVARGLVEPVQVTAPRSEVRRLYVVEQRGTIRVIDGGKLRG